MEQNLKKFLNTFFNFKIGGKKVTIPYWMNKLDKKIYGPFGGKGTPEEIRKATYDAAIEDKIKLKNLNSEEIYKFMKKKRIGLDCSGFTYQLLNFLDFQKGGDGLDNTVAGTGGMGIRKVNADSLTNSTNSLAVELIDQIRIGDTIRFRRGKHVAVVVSVSDQEILYVHISSFSEIPGPHLSTIKIIDKKRSLKDQIWLEKTIGNKNYGRQYFKPEFGDSIRRLKIWA